MTQGVITATVRVATWNVLHGLDLRRGAIDLSAVAAAVAGMEADVIALQEVDRGLGRSGGVDQAQHIAEQLGMDVVFAPALLGDPDSAWQAVRDGAADDGGGYGVALLSRFPLTAVTRITLPGGGDGARRPTGGQRMSPGWDREPRAGVRARVAVGGRELTVATTHLSYLPWRGVRQLRRLLRSLGGTSPAVLMGDFNLPPRAVAAAAWGWTGAGGAPTYPASAPRMQVDQILVRGARVTGVRVAEPSTSDHRAVIADLTLR